MVINANSEFLTRPVQTESHQVTRFRSTARICRGCQIGAAIENGRFATKQPCAMMGARLVVALLCLWTHPSIGGDFSPSLESRQCDGRHCLRTEYGREMEVRIESSELRKSIRGLVAGRVRDRRCRRTRMVLTIHFAVDEPATAERRRHRATAIAASHRRGSACPDP